MIVPYHLFCYSCSEMQKLDQDHSRLERTCEVAEKMGASLREAHSHFHSMLKKTAEQQKKYESEVVAFRGLFLETRHSRSYMKPQMNDRFLSMYYTCMKKPELFFDDDWGGGGGALCPAKKKIKPKIFFFFKKKY
jgi:hypothetical protein